MSLQSHLLALCPSLKPLDTPPFAQMTHDMPPAQPLGAPIPSTAAISTAKLESLGRRARSCAPTVQWFTGKYT